MVRAERECILLARPGPASAAYKGAGVTMRRARLGLVVFACACVVTLPLFFDSYRNLAFRTMPLDDYASFVLRLVTGVGQWPGSPFGYRVGGVLPAAFFFHLLPLYRFTYLPLTINAEHLKALEALAFVSYLSCAAAAAIAFLMMPGQLSMSAFAATLAPLLMFAYVGTEGVDAFAVFLIFLLLYWLDRRPSLFVLAIVLTPFINEKIPIFFALLAFVRSMCLRTWFRTHLNQVFGITIAALMYVCALAFIHLPGNEFQTTPTLYLTEIEDTLHTTLSSLKGLVLNLFYSGVIIAPLLLAEGRTVGVSRCDALVPVGLFILAMAVRAGVTVWHVVAYAVPLATLAVGELILKYEVAPVMGPMGKETE